VECDDSKNKLISKRESIVIIEYKNKFQENINLFENSCNNTKNVFFNVCHEFGLLMSIIVNLMLMNDYSNNITKICDKNFLKEKKAELIKTGEFLVDESKGNENGGLLVQFDDFFKSLDLFKNDFNSTQGPYSYVNKYIIQIVLARLINNPIGKIEFDKSKYK
jgi:hypothetical protein